MKAVLFLVFFSFIAFADNRVNEISAERKAFLQDFLITAYDQDHVDEVNMQRKVKSQIIAELPEKFLECILGDPDIIEENLPPSFQSSTCVDIISAAKKAGISQAQIESNIVQQPDSELTPDRIKALQESLAHIYSETLGDKLELNDLKTQIMAQLPKQLSNCRKEEDTLDKFIPDVFQDPLCGKIITEAMEAGISYAWLTDILDDLTVVEGSYSTAEKKKTKTIAKP